MLLEATLENATKAAMQLDAVSFFPSPAFTAERIGGGCSSTSGASSSSGRGGGSPPDATDPSQQSLPLIPEGCAFSFIFRLLKAPPPPSSHMSSSPFPAAAAAAAAASSGGSSPGSASAAAAAAAVAYAAAEASGALGKIEIRWRGATGEPARLQTQQISLPQQVGGWAGWWAGGLDGRLEIAVARVGKQEQVPPLSSDVCCVCHFFRAAAGPPRGRLGPGPPAGACGGGHTIHRNLQSAEPRGSLHGAAAAGRSSS